MMMMMKVRSPTVPLIKPLLLRQRLQQQQQQQRIRRRLFLFIVVLLLLPGICWSMPTYILDIPSQKCIEVEGPVDSTIRIAYFMPDLNLDEKDEHYTGPVQFTLHTVPSNRVTDTKHHAAPVLSRLRPISQSLRTKTGQIEHTFEVDGTATICFTTDKTAHHVKTATIRHLRLAIHVERKEIADLLLQLENTDNNNNTSTEITNLDSKKTQHHLSRMQVELQRIQLSLKTILNEADLAKERDAIAHKQVISVHSASMFWPIVQSGVLIMTGFTQASHIVHFFKTRRII